MYWTWVHTTIPDLRLYFGDYSLVMTVLFRVPPETVHWILPRRCLDATAKDVNRIHLIQSIVQSKMWSSYQAGLLPTPCSRVTVEYRIVPTRQISGLLPAMSVLSLSLGSKPDIPHGSTPNFGFFRLPAVSE